jgi:hypothetical protein
MMAYFPPVVSEFIHIQPHSGLWEIVSALTLRLRRRLFTFNPIRGWEIIVAYFPPVVPEVIHIQPHSGLGYKNNLYQIYESFVFPTLKRVEYE